MKMQWLARVSPLLLLSASAVGAENLYVGAKVGNVTADNFAPLVESRTAIDDSDTSYGLFVGYHIVDTLAIEGGYNYLGEYDLKDIAGGSYEASSFDVVLKASGNVTDSLALYAKGGFAVYDWKANGPGVESDDSGVTPTIAFGSEYSITSAMKVGIEYQIYDDIGGVNIDSFNVALSYSF